MRRQTVTVRVYHEGRPTGNVYTGLTLASAHRTARGWARSGFAACVHKGKKIIACYPRGIVGDPRRRRRRRS